MKATKVDGIYSADPKKDKTARLYHQITYDQVLRDELKVMDLTAFTMAKQQKIPLVVFNLKKDGNIARVVRGELWLVGLHIPGCPGERDPGGPPRAACDRARRARVVFEVVLAAA